MTPNTTLQRRTARGLSASRACWPAGRYGPQSHCHQPCGTGKATS